MVEGVNGAFDPGDPAVAVAGFDATGVANRSALPSLGTLTGDSFPYAIGVVACGLASQGEVEFDATILPPDAGAFQASVLPVDDKAAALLATAGLFGGDVELCMTGSGSPW